MDLALQQKQGWSIVSLPEEIDAQTVGDFEQGMTDLLPAEGRVRLILDFSGTQYIDSAGIGGVVRLFRRLKERQGLMVIASCRENVRKILNLINLQRFIPVFDTVEQALAGENL